MTKSRPVVFKRGDVAETWGEDRGQVARVEKRGTEQWVELEVEGGTWTGPARVFTFLFRPQSQSAGAR